MKVSFPRMGYSYVAFKWLFERIGYEVVLPHEPNNTTLDLGVRYSPEFACIPFKILTGLYLQAAEEGAELIVTSGGIGPCRAGYYWIMHQRIMDELGMQVEVIGFEPPMRDLPDFIKKLHRIRRMGGASVRTYVQSIKTAWQKLLAIDEMETLSYEIRPYEVTRGDTTRALDQALKILDAAEDIPQVKTAWKDARAVMEGVKQDRSRNPLKVGIVGEIYVLLEPSANHYLQTILGEMGVYTDRSMYITKYTMDGTDPSREDHVREAAHSFLGEACIGGHGVNSIGETVLYARSGFDGVIQLAPFSCIPEIVAKSIMPRVSRELDIPVLTVFIDEQTGKTGMETRLEAFIDLLDKRRERKHPGSAAPVLHMPERRACPETVTRAARG